MASPQTVVKLDMTAHLEPQLEHAPQDAENLHLDEEIPTNDAWVSLSKHFTSVKDLHMDSGWNEELNDRDIPLHWPLEKLTISSACGEVCRSPWIVQGKVPHLVLDYTAGLRFEGPTTAELTAANNDAIKKREKDESPHKVGDIQITFVPDLVAEWMRKKYADDDGDNNKGENEPTTEAPPPPTPSNLRTLEIIYNDARDTLYRYVLAHPTLIDPVQTLSLIAKSKHDLSIGDERILEDLLPQLTHLTALVLVLGDHYRDREQLPAFFKHFPPNVETLRFQSSVSLAREEVVVERWVDAFGDPEFLPRLKRLSFVLDLEDGEGERRENEEWERLHPQRDGEEEEEEKEVDDDVAGKDAKTGEDDASSSPSEESDNGAEGSKDPDEVKQDTAESAETAEKTAPAPVQKPPPNVSDEVLARAKRACERVERAAESRGVIIDSFMGVWRQGFTGLTHVDYRWDNL
ncbi:uncharacterized protein BKCO1_5000111 [Diplodia corticola]|uniref:Uncharacterized protein n=1 Tax=Diplodia corticola TaxID=236234 RepID=A0A1J9RCQ9_9PEZI|nr:uncharacterized protein BKCO1_5000111 [Diplodia corticola]OJD37906.1 hypothetical protein BKCO1_5000111 [Diplodia corticola]